MIFPVVFVLLCARLTESLLNGESCTLSYGASGVCKPLYSCRSEFDLVVAGYFPKKVCEYKGPHPIVCCPLNNAAMSITPTPLPVTPTYKKRIGDGDGRGDISRQKCEYYSQFVYSRKYSLRGDPLNKSECAITSQKLIVGGTRADQKEFPHMVALGSDKEDGTIGWFCGGTLVSENWVVTAAHCVYPRNSGHAAWARLGDLNLMDSVRDGANPVTLRIVERIKHPDYKLPAFYNDIALVRLEENVAFNGWIRPACLHTAESTGTSEAVATGWGPIDWFDDRQSDLLKDSLRLIDTATCNARWMASGTEIKVPKGINATTMICADMPGCQGDGGGPLVVLSPEKYECMYDLVGVVSIGELCGVDFPGIYTRVYHYVPWIESIVWPRG